MTAGGLSGQMVLFKAGALACALACAFYYVQHYSLQLAGGVPLANLGIAPGIVEAELGDLSGQTFVVTGANSGLGLSSVKLLARHNARVLLGCRSLAKCEAAVVEVRHANPRAELVVPGALDLSSLRSVRAFATAVRADAGVAAGKLKSLVCNAGFVPNAFSLTAEGVEDSFAGNHLGHFELFRLLSEDLVRARPSTVVTVSSNVHTQPLATSRGVPQSLAELNDPRGFDSVRRYGMGKLANILHVKEIDRRYYSRGITATAVHPGGVDTAFLNAVKGGRSLSSWMDPVFKLFAFVAPLLFWESDVVAITIVAAAVKPKGHGEFTVPIHRVFTPSAQAQDMVAAKDLWDLSAAIADGIK